MDAIISLLLPGVKLSKRVFPLRMALSLEEAPSMVGNQSSQENSLRVSDCHFDLISSLSPFHPVANIPSKDIYGLCAMRSLLC